MPRGQDRVLGIPQILVGFRAEAFFVLVGKQSEQGSSHVDGDGCRRKPPRVPSLVLEQKLTAWKTPLLRGEKYPRCAPELPAKPGSKACPGGWAAPRDGHGHRGEALRQSQAAPRDCEGPGRGASLWGGEGRLPRAVYCPGDKAALFSSPGHPE